ncbi:hypothetical protein HBI40_227460 [Parastagonospora nodorum]|nr:hypothetical protein HBI43_020580 [Parastagonospora nodorum]KAH6242311.1 hypothetical protein HBI42_234720 [Parastagonospora nodorum]KAH6265965.1 hypothetical protein HBI40_227460 [Parastagonospora nodorum]KAH6279008.1 hypothetical protein HBI41_026450 [Parastagonospora nodorum]
MSLSAECELPEELLDHIISFSTRETLMRLCLVSKQLCRLATAHLYSVVIPGASNDAYKNVSHVTHLAHTLLKSPAHARLVTGVVLEQPWGPNPEYAEEDGPECPWPDVGIHGLETLLRSKLAKFALNQADAESVYDKIEAGLNEDVIVALLLLSLPNLRRLDMNAGFSDGHPDFVSVFELLADQLKSRDDHLTPQVDVMVRGDDDKYPNPPVHVAALMHMPNLRSIYAWKMGDHEGDAGPDFARLKPRSSPVEYIELRTSKLHNDNFRLLMNATKPGSLKTLVYEIGCAWAWCQISHLDIMTSLQAHHQTLEALCLSHEKFYPHQFDNDYEKPYPCDFKPFTALKRLKVAPVYIWGIEGFSNQANLADGATKEMLWKLLPASLQQLWICRAESQAKPPPDNDAETLRFEDDCLLPALNLVVRKKEAFPKLNEIVIELPPRKWPKHETFNNLESFCRGAQSLGIRTRIILSDVIGGLEERKWGWEEEVEWGDCLANQGTKKMLVEVDAVDDLARLIREVTNEADAKMPRPR